MFDCNNFLTNFPNFSFKLEFCYLFFVETSSFSFQFLNFLLYLSISQRFFILSTKVFLFLDRFCLFRNFSCCFLFFGSFFIFFFDKLIFYIGNLFINYSLSCIGNLFRLNFFNELIDTSSFFCLFIILIFKRYRFSLFLFISL